MSVCSGVDETELSALGELFFLLVDRIIDKVGTWKLEIVLNLLVLRTPRC